MQLSLLSRRPQPRPRLKKKGTNDRSCRGRCRGSESRGRSCGLENNTHLAAVAEAAARRAAAEATAQKHAIKFQKVSFGATKSKLPSGWRGRFRGGGGGSRTKMSSDIAQNNTRTKLAILYHKMQPNNFFPGLEAWKKVVRWSFGAPREAFYTAQNSTRTKFAILYHKKQPNNFFSRPGGLEKSC